MIIRKTILKYISLFELFCCCQGIYIQFDALIQIVNENSITAFIGYIIFMIVGLTCFIIIYIGNIIRRVYEIREKEDEWEIKTCLKNFIINKDSDIKVIKYKNYYELLIFQKHIFNPRCYTKILAYKKDSVTIGVEKIIFTDYEINAIFKDKVE